MSSIDGLRRRDEKSTKTASVKAKNLTIQEVKKRPSQTSKKPQKNPVNKPSLEKKEAPEQAREDFLEPVKSFDFNLTSDDLMEGKAKEKKTKKKEKKKFSKKKKVVIGILIFIVLLLSGVLVVALVWGNDLISKITGGQSGIWDAWNLVTENYVDLKADEKGRTNILVFGTSGYNMNGDEGNGVHDGAQLTDSIMLFSLDQKTGDVAMVSLPRDLKAGATCTATGKVNEVYWCANQYGEDEAAGAQALMNKVSYIFDVDFQYYIHVNWAALTTVVDSIGGITVTLDEDINDYEYTNTIISAGVPTTLNGEQALGLARARHGTELGDFSRGNSQQKILVAIKDKILENGLDWSSAINLLNALGDNLRTDISLEEMKTGLHLSQTLDMNSVRQVPLIDWNNDVHYMSTATINGISYVIPSAGVDNYTALQKYIAKMFTSDPIEREDATIEVLNGTDESGVAAKEQEELSKEGITVTIIGDAPDGEYSGYSLYSLTEEKSGTKKLLENYYHTTAKTAAELPSGVETNCDFLVVVGK